MANLTDPMDRNEMVKQFKAVFGSDQRFPLGVSSSDNPAQQSIQMDVSITFGCSSQMKKSSLAKLSFASEAPRVMAEKLRKYMIERLREKADEWEAMDV